LQLQLQLQLQLHLHLHLLLGRAGLQPRVKASRKAAYRSAEGRSEARRGEATNSLPSFLPLHFFSRF
jgi:hypothetical protein